MLNLVNLPGIMEAAGGVFSDAVALVKLPEQQAAGIGGDPAPGKIGNDFLGEKALKDELFMADCFHRVSLLRSCLFSDNSILADTLCIFKHFSVEERLGAVASKLRFPTPLIEPDLPISGIRLSDWIHPKAHGGGPR
jgi:hypothetical protein